MNKKVRIKKVGRRDFLKIGTMAAISVSFKNNNERLSPRDNSEQQVSAIKPEWRNRQDGMSYRLLGRTGFMVSELVFGSERITPDNVRPIEIAIERGINYFDTAPLYGNGKSETNLGNVLAQLQPDVLVATKVSISRDNLKDIKDAVQRSLETSLSRLKRDHVDVIQLHTPVSLERPSGPRSLPPCPHTVCSTLQRSRSCCPW